MVFSDIYIADSGRAINNTGVVTRFSQVYSSGTYAHRVDGRNAYVSPSGYGGNVNVSTYANRFDDAGYYFTAHSGNFYGNVVRDVRQVNN